MAGRNGYENLYEYFKSWQRLEARGRDDKFDEGLEARTADPLWFLARQWQLGEFQAEDAGSLVTTYVECLSERVSSLIRGENDEFPLDAKSPPLEVLVEQELVNWDWRMRIRAGRQFEQLLREASADESVTKTFIESLRNDDRFSITSKDLEDLDRTTKLMVSVMIHRAIDGLKLWEHIKRSSLIDPKGQLDPAVIADAVAKLKKWYGDLFSQPSTDYPSTWQPMTLDYRFGLKAPYGEGGETNLISTQYRNGDLEWHTSNLQSERLPANSDTLVANRKVSLVPTRVRYGGMPLPRWWAMEDYAINFGEMDVAPTDLIKTLLAEFALVHGDDWFVIPLALHTGTVSYIISLKTTDVFGETIPIDPARLNDANPLKRWDLFSLTDSAKLFDNAKSDFLYIPPSTGYREESEPVEEVLFLRDEGANMVWGVERTVPNGWGKSVSAFDLHNEKNWNPSDTSDQNASEKSSQKLSYRLATTVPPNWIPFIPRRIKSTFDQIKLQRAEMPSNEGSDGVKPLSRLFNGENRSDMINEEAITRAGVKVQITKQRVRWVDGRTYVWIGRKVITGKGEGSSGLVFDSVASRGKNNGSAID